MMNDFMVLSDEDEVFLLEHIINNSGSDDDDDDNEAANKQKNHHDLSTTIIDSSKEDSNGSLNFNLYKHWEEHDKNDPLNLLQLWSTDPDEDKTRQGNDITEDVNVCDIEPVPLSNILQQAQPRHQHDHYEATNNNNDDDDEKKEEEVSSYDEERIMSPLALPPSANSTTTPTSSLPSMSSFSFPTKGYCCETTAAVGIITDESVQDESNTDNTCCSDSISIASHTTTATTTTSSSCNSIHTISSSSSLSCSSQQIKATNTNDKVAASCLPLLKDEKTLTTAIAAVGNKIDEEVVTKHTTTIVSEHNDYSTNEAKRRRAIRKEILHANKVASKAVVTDGFPITQRSTFRLPSLDETTTTTTTEGEEEPIAVVAQLLLNDALNRGNNDEPALSSKQQHDMVTFASSPKTTKSGIYCVDIQNNKDASNSTTTVPPHNKKSKQTRRDSTKKTSISTKISSRSSNSGRTSKRTHATKETLPFDTTNNKTHEQKTELMDDNPSKDNYVPDHLADLPTGTDPESRKQRRLMRNRLSAALHRKRKRETIDTQQKLLDEKDSEITKLTEELQKMTLNYEEIKHDFDIIVNHYGYSSIKTILGRAAAASSEEVVDLVSTDRSSNDDLSSEEDTTPKFFLSNKEEERSSTRNSHCPSSSPQVAAVSLPSTTHKKKKRTFAAVHNYIPATAMATMAMCAVLSCVLLPSGLFKVLDPDGSGLDTANGIVSSEFGSDARRRLDEALSPDEMNDLMKFSRNNQRQKWTSSLKNIVVPSYYRDNNNDSSLVSPNMECQPHLWRYDETTGSPWIVDHSITLFDVDPQKSSVLPIIPSMMMKEQSSALSSPSLMMSSLLLPSATAHEEMQVVYPKPNLRGSSYTAYESNGGSDHHHGSTMFDSSISNNDEDESKSIDLFYRQRRRTVGAGISHDRTTSTSLSPNFMFCPKAYGSFQSDFMQLMLRGRSSNAAVPTIRRTSTSQEDEESDLYKSKDDIKCDMIVDFDDDDDDDDDIDDETFKDAIAEIMDIAEEEDNKGLVVAPPRYYDDGDLPFSHPNHDDDNTSFTRTPVVKMSNDDDILVEEPSSASMPPYMSILVPASTLLLPNDINTMSSSWDEEQNTNSTGDNHDHDQHKQEAWIELGCHVLTAKLVDGVHFVGDTKGGSSRFL